MDINAIATGMFNQYPTNKIDIKNLIIFLYINQMTVKPGLTGCIVLVILFHYFSLTNFFWMLVEGKPFK